MTEELTDADWARINARGAASAERQRREREERQRPRPAYRSLAEAPGGTELRKVFHRGVLVGYEPVPHQSLGTRTATGFTNGTIS